jgi:hypothetical protein
MPYEDKDDYLPRKDFGFFLKEGWLWLVGAFLFILSVLSLTEIIHLTYYNDWEAAPYFGPSLFDYFIHTFPFLLLIPLLVAFMLFLFILRNSVYIKSLSFYFFITLSLFSLIIASLLGFYLKMGDCLDKKLADYKFYETINKNRYELWQTPDHGLLAGQIGTIDDANNFLLIDFEGRSWFVKTAAAPALNLPLLKTGEYLKLLGRQSGPDSFEAKSIKIFK